MPPRKSDVSKVATGDEGSGTPAKDKASQDKEKDGVNIEDLNLPKSIVTRLAKGVLPPNTQIQGNAMLAMTKGATVFVSYVATHANEYAQNANRKTIAPADVFKALEDLEFPDFKDRLEAELAKFNEVQTEKRNTYRKKVAADKDKAGDGKTGSQGDGGETNGSGEVVSGHAGQEQNGREGEPVAKKLRMGEGGEERIEHGDMEEDEIIGDIGDEEAEEDPLDDDVEDDEEGADENDEPPEDTQDEPEERAIEVEDEALDNGDDSD